jgi:integrase
MGRKRLAKNRGFPPNLYQNSAGYYYYLHPKSRKVKGLGRDKANAYQEARAANAALANDTPSSLVDWVLGKTDYTLAGWMPIYRKLWLEQKDKPPARNTVRAFDLSIRKIGEADYAWRRLPAVETAHIAAHLIDLTENSGPASALAVRIRLADAFRMAETQGLIPKGSNPVTSTYTPSKHVKRERLSLDQFNAIRAKAPHWLKNAMDLALVTAQRREDVANMKFSDFYDGHLHVVQGKGGGATRLRIAGATRLSAVGMSIESVIKGCRDHVLSPYIVHHIAKVNQVHAGAGVTINGISNAFQRAREAAEILPAEGRTPPSFHEIRSLAERLYRDEYGAEFAQAILGHKHASMTAKYDDMRGQGWDVVVPKIL